jgi:hypothetical protein
MSERYGPHLAFPFRIGADGRAAQVTSLEAHVRDELVQLLLTNLGERAFLPTFGGGVRRLVFEPVDEAARGVVKAQLTQAITNWLGHRVDLENLTVDLDDTTLSVTIQYRLAGSEESRVLTFQRSGEQ